MKLVEYLNSLPHYSVKVITTSNGSKKVEFRTEIHKTKLHVSNNSWSAEYTNHEILYSPEVEKWLISITGYKQITTWSL